MVLACKSKCPKKITNPIPNTEMVHKWNLFDCVLKERNDFVEFLLPSSLF